MFKHSKIITFIATILISLTTVFAAACSSNKGTNKSYALTKGATQNGTFTVEVDNKEANSAKKGDYVFVTPQPNGGYQTQSVYYIKSGETQKTDISYNSGKYSFSMPASDVTVYVSFSKTQQPEDTYTLTTAATQNGSFTVTADGKAVQNGAAIKENAVITISPVPESGYTVSEVYYKNSQSQNVKVSNTSGAYTFNMPASNVTVYVTFSKLPEVSYTLTTTATQNGSFTVTADGKAVQSGANIYANSNIVVKPAPTDDYIVDEVYYTTQSGDKTTVDITAEGFTFKMPENNITLYVTFAVSGIVFELADDGNSYVATYYNGDKTDVIIPSTYKGKPVSGIDGFSPDPEISAEISKLERVFIPSSVQTIGMSAFNSSENLKTVVFEKQSQLETIGMYAFGMTGLTSIEIPASVTKIDGSAFDSCLSLTEITFEENSNLREIVANAFGSTAIKSIVIPASVETIDAFTYCEQLETVTFEEGSKLRKIGDNCFMASSVKSIVIPESVETIGANAFTGATNFDTVYYGGDAFKWGSITNRPQSATVYYYSQTRPSSAGKYWHYGANSMPVKWN